MTSKFDELRWIFQIRQGLEEEVEEDGDIQLVCIFSVPKSLFSSDPHSYMPQQVALGPYHHWRPELNGMERYKVAAAKRVQKQLQTHEFQNLVDQLIKLESRIRECYHMYIDFNGETLAWMMALDASFLLEILQSYGIVNEGKEIVRVSSGMSQLVDYTGRKSAYNAILRDMIMLENQIPLFILRKVMELRFSPQEPVDDMLFSMLMGFCNELSPFKMMEKFPKIQVSDSSHMLDFLYHIITPEVEEPSVAITVEYQDEPKEEGNGWFGDTGYIKQLIEQTWNLLSRLNIGLIQSIRKVSTSRPVKVILKLPWKLISNLRGFSFLKLAVEYFFLTQDKEAVKPENGSSSSNSNIYKPPLVEEIAIPSVTKLSKSGVRFSPTNGGISTVEFNIKTATLYLPIVSVDVNTEVVLRNLVAYEASNASGPLVFTRYTELMNGIVDTEEDVRRLRERGIILNHLKSDLEVANLWNGMSKSIRLTRVPFLDKVIEDVNKHYNSRWKVKADKFMKHYVFASWKILSLLAAIMLLLLMSFQAFCSVYNARIFQVKIT
ncbi:putative UPF0481 protein At3g02645 [Malania oleifera]|uniref:putative UPF0481 protein At3g02645 n=1 Tax=Malania oleifera TaxID=397392 RepID=UPI0025ADCF23|nr:putative UPF0481 protein At3g02645 [Malania oleifera]